MSVVARGALAGWKRQATNNGYVVTLQVAASTQAFRSGDFDVVEVALNDRQLRSLARDLRRAAASRGLELAARVPWWKTALRLDRQ